MLQAQASERELIDQFLAALRSLPEVQAELQSAGAPEHDAQLALDVASKHIHALVKLRKAVYPRDVRQLVWRIRDLARQQPAGESSGEPLAILVAESISLWKCVVQVNGLRGRHSLWRWFRETRRSELLVVFGEDIAATLGLALALLAVAAAQFARRDLRPQSEGVRR